MRVAHRARVLWGAAVCATAVWACETAANTGGIQRDVVQPRLTLTTPNKTTPKRDTQNITAGLHFTATASDNVALDSIHIVFTGGFIAVKDTGFSGAQTTATIQYSLSPTQLAGSGGLIQIVGTARDGAGNRSRPDTINIFLTNTQALQVSLLAPSAGALAGSGKYVPIQVKAVQKAGGVKLVGWVIGGAAGQTSATSDSVFTGAAPYPDSTVFTDSVLVTGTTGNFTVVGFAVDSAGRRASSLPVTVSIQSVATDNTAPLVEQFVANPMEATDSIRVHATDPSGITRMGFTAVKLGTATVVGGDSLNYAGTSTDQAKNFSLKLNLGLLGPLPQQIVIQSFAIDGAIALNRGVTGLSFTTPSPPGASKTDTVTIVNGRTFPLPAGGTIADAIYDKNTQELYLTNNSLSRVEVFQVANTAFVANGIPSAGPQPVGIALWPKDTLGSYADTIVVANSGGTELTVINVGAGGPQQILWRQPLPNYLIEKYQVINNGGFYSAKITVSDVSDRPQYLGTVCRPAGGTACDPNGIYAIYSTTPTASSSSPFAGHATLRMERLTQNPANYFGHFFWEIGNQGLNISGDTLRVEEIRGNTSTVTLSACAGVMINFATFGLGDSTFVRNSGNFTHAFMGEGGNIAASFARVMSYNAQLPINAGAGTFTSCNPAPGVTDAGDNDVDNGMSPGFQVSDFISNTGVHISSIATNFNGLTNAVRADSIYYLDAGLRLAATSPTAVGAPGMDMNYNHTFSPFGNCTPCGGAGSPNDRIIFAALPDATIGVYDTFHGAQIGTIAIRDPIIGPLRVAKDPLGNQLLFGITARGLVMVALPAFINPLPTALH
ncbi:MAG TPA: hypothetical protein VI160_03145 [Gemmatimonadales bacterium]